MGLGIAALVYLRPFLRTGDAVMLSGFLDGFLLNVAAIVATITAFDWLVGENGRRRLREYVGDFWTTLQYKSLDELYIIALQKLRTKIIRIYGDRVFSTRFILVAFVVNLLWLIPIIVLNALWTKLGAELVELAPVLPKVTYVGIAITMFAYILVCGWFPVANLIWVIHRIPSDASLWRVLFSAAFVLLMAIVFVAVAVVIFFSCYLVFISATFGLENLEQLFQQMIRDQQELGLDPVNNEAFNDFTTKFMFPFVGFMFFIVLPVSLLPFFALLLIVLVLAALKMLRPLLQPVLSLLLQRLYESKQGVATQIALALGAVSKILQEVLKSAA
jgi:hypothetical protein